jgi:hypothetical protein
MNEYFKIQGWKNIITQEGHCTIGYNIHIPKEVEQLFPPSKIDVWGTPTCHTPLLIPVTAHPVVVSPHITLPLSPSCPYLLPTFNRAPLFITAVTTA